MMTSIMDTEDCPYVTLPDGSRVDIGTEEGANALLLAGCGEEYISSKLKEIRKIRNKNRLLPQDEEKLQILHGFIAFFVVNADQQLFREKIPESEIQRWLDHVIQELKKLTNKRNWISTGELDGIDEMELASHCVSMMAKHAVPVALAFEGDFFRVLADFVASRKGNGRALPSTSVCKAIGLIVSTSIRVAQLNFDNKWTAEKIFKKFEVCGMLEQFLRCVTVLVTVDKETAHQMLDQLQSCTVILSKKFKRGDPCGETLRAIVDGKDGSKTILPEIFTRLDGIATLAAAMESPDDLCKCNYCAKSSSSEAFQKSLMVCSRCRTTQYCSKTCQIADWTQHKPLCKPVPKIEKNSKECKWVERRTLSTSNMLYNFFSQHADTLVTKIDETCKRNLSGVAIEIDFMPNKDGQIPAFQDPPVIKIAPFQDYIEGREVPDSISQRSNPNENAELFRARLKEGEVLDEDARFLIHYADGIVMIPFTAKDFDGIRRDCLTDVMGRKCHKFVFDHCVDITTKIVELCDNQGWEMKDLVLEVDFGAKTNGVMPTMQDFPVFKIASANSYFDGSRPDEADWFSNDDDPEGHERNKAKFVELIKESRERLAEEVAILVHDMGVMQCFWSKTHRIDIFNAECLESFKDQYMYSIMGKKGTLFTNTNYVAVMVKIIEFCDRTGSEMEDLVLELDFMPNKHGVIPALQDPPVFKIATSESYVDGSRPEEADWFLNDAHCKVDESEKKELIAHAKENSEFILQDVSFCVRYAGEMVFMRSKGNDKIITPKALDAFRTVMEDLDFVPLYEVFDELNLDGSYYIYKLEEELGIGWEYWSAREEDDDYDEKDGEGSNGSIGSKV
mmetsp:Transcript_17602/g.43307  ORF Transcript_17602/g.43307 Transcript_17602/m.43307 type:complete len:847 (+) Transcript_17602:218-2758(+)